jgi:hypothetical protein
MKEENAIKYQREETRGVNAGTGVGNRRRWSKGFINPRKVKLAAFSIITFCIVACTLTSILAVWDFTKGDAVWRAFATFLIVAVATGIFAVVNEKFGD